MRSDSKPRYRLDRGRMVEIHVCPPGNAWGSNEFSNRGLPDIYREVTVWPKTNHYALTTGEPIHVMGLPDPVKLNEQELWMCKVLGLSGEELGIFLRSWDPRNKENNNRGGAGPRPTDLPTMQKALYHAGNARPMQKKEQRVSAIR